MSKLDEAIHQLSTEFVVPFHPHPDSWLPSTAELVEPERAAEFLSHTPNVDEERWRAYLLVGLIYYGLLNRHEKFPDAALLAFAAGAIENRGVGLSLFVELNIPFPERPDDEHRKWVDWLRSLSLLT